MEITIIVGKIVCLAFMMTHIPFLFKNIITLGKRKRIIDWLDLMSCLKCNSFWVTLMYTQDIWMASAAGVVGFLVDKYILFSPTKL